MAPDTSLSFHCAPIPGQPCPRQSVELPCGLLLSQRAHWHRDLHLSSKCTTRPLYASQVSQEDIEDPPLSSSHYDDRPQYETPFKCLAQEAARRIPFIKAAAGTLGDLLSAHLSVMERLSDRLLGQSMANCTRQIGLRFSVVHSVNTSRRIKQRMSYHVNRVSSASAVLQMCSYAPAVCCAKNDFAPVPILTHRAVIAPGKGHGPDQDGGGEDEDRRWCETWWGRS